MPEKKEEEETPERGVRRIDMKALERGVRKALEIKPKDHSGREKQGRGSQEEQARQDKKE